LVEGFLLVSSVRDDNDINTEKEIETRSRVRARGYRLMHRRGGQYWLMVGLPLSLEQINRGIENMPAIIGGMA
jgi:hypothetical protein